MKTYFSTGWDGIVSIEKAESQDPGHVCMMGIGIFGHRK